MKISFPQIALVYDRKSVSSPKKEGIIEVRITHNRKQRYISTGIKVLPNQWRKNAVVNRTDSTQLNQYINSLLTNIQQVICEMSHAGCIDISLISGRLQKKEEISFFEFCLQRAEIRKYGKKKDSQERYDRFLRLFAKWGRIRTFEDITENNIIKYDRYLDSQRLKPYSKWNNYHRFLNSFIIDAIKEGYLTRNPYNWLNIDRTQDTSLKKYLTPEEFHRIKIAELPTISLERVRDLFVFQTYTCLSYTDLRDFDASEITEVKGMKVYMGNRQKTRKNFTIPLLKEPLGILEKYNGKLPIISNVKYNEYLKLVAQAAGIDKPLSTHWARHTGATLLLNEGIDMRIVSKICGHSSTKITEQVYAKLLDETVVDAISRIDKL